MSYSFLEHTADIRMDVESATQRTLFQDAMIGMFKILKPSNLSRHVEQAVTLRSSDATALLVDFLNEVLALAQSNKESYSSVIFERFSGNELTAKLEGNRVSSFGDDIKAVTYHEANVECDSSGMWRAHVIFDV